MSAETTAITVPFSIPVMVKLFREHDAIDVFPMDLWEAAAAQHGAADAGKLWDGAARELFRQIPVQLEPPTSEDLAHLDEVGFNDAGRSLLPGVYHRPMFDGLGQPNSWLCSICWTEGIANPWPCLALAGNRAASVALAEHLGLEWSA